MDLYTPYLDDARVKTVREFCQDKVHVRGSVAAIEAIVSNLLTNSVKAFKRKEAELGNRTLLVRTAVTEYGAQIRVSDSGLGIDEGLGNTIWLPGVTIDEDGTGICLTIVWDTVADPGGNIGFSPHGEMGGAEFIIELPRVES